MSTGPAEKPSPPEAVPATSVAAGAPVQLDSARLFDGRRELVILHNGEPYRLRITRQEKLILTK